jgi:predicted ester cyclase
VTPEADLSAIYRGYIACLNSQDWPRLGTFVDDDAHYNGPRVGVSAGKKEKKRKKKMEK